MNLDFGKVLLGWNWTALPLALFGKNSLVGKNNKNNSCNKSFHIMNVSMTSGIWVELRQFSAAIICCNDELSSSLTRLDCLQIDWENVILLAESNQILLKNYFILILLTFKYLVALYQKTEL